MRLVLLIIAGALLAFGPLALFATDTAASAFGIPADSAASRAYVLATATRDVALGCWLLALLGLRAGRRVLAASVLAIALVAAGDAANVAAHAGWQGASALVIHIGGLVALIVVGVWVWRAGTE
jgi:hypothetical protein